MNKEERQQMFEELFDHATESIIVTDHDGKIKFVNPATEKIFGYDAEEIREKTVEFLMPDRFARKHVSHRENYTADPHARSMGIGIDLFARRKDGSEFPVEISLSPFRHQDKQFVIAFIIDITKRKLIEASVVKQKIELEKLTQELKGINEKLELKVIARTQVLSEALNELENSKRDLSEALEKEKDLNELKTRFISMASHEFRTPLTTILSSASLIDDYKLSEQNDKRAKHVSRIKSAVNNLNDILSDFLSISKIEEGRTNASNISFNIRQTTEEICNDMKGVVKDGQKIVYAHTGETHVILDQKLYRNILINLMSNAIKFSDQNKKIVVATYVDNDIIKLEVQDQGIGISADDRKHLFERFFRGHNVLNIQGTGLGLNIVASYVDLMKGTIDVESKLEEGTRFIITFPIYNYE